MNISPTKQLRFFRGKGGNACLDIFYSKFNYLAELELWREAFKEGEGNSDLLEGARGKGGWEKQIQFTGSLSPLPPSFSLFLSEKKCEVRPWYYICQ